MAGIVFYYEHEDMEVWFGRQDNLVVWNYACKLSDIDKAIIINTTHRPLITFDADMKIDIVSDFDFKNLEGNTTQIVVPNEVDNDTSLWDFDHKTDWYIFGPARGWLGDYFADNHIYIPQNSNGYNYSFLVAPTIMFDRHNKLINK